MVFISYCFLLKVYWIQRADIKVSDVQVTSARWHQGI